MNALSKRNVLTGLVILGVAALGWKAQRVYADFGIPSPGALSYKGTLQNNSGPYDGIADFEVALFDSPVLDQELCRVTAGATPVSGGRFEVELSDACTTAVENNDEAWILVTVDIGDGPQSFDVERIHASAYAVSAKKADTAHNGVPVGGIIWWTQPGGAGIPDGFQLCDGGGITTGPMAGSIAPNLIGRFARGATSTNLQPVGASSTSTSSSGDHTHFVASFFDSTNEWRGLDINGDSQVLINYGNAATQGLGGGGGTFPLSFQDNTGNKQLRTSRDGEHNHTIAEPVPRHVPLLPLIRIR